MEHVSHGDEDAPMPSSTSGLFGRLKSIVKHRIWGLDKRWSYKKGWTDLKDLYDVWRVFEQGAAFWGLRWLHPH